MEFHSHRTCYQWAKSRGMTDAKDHGQFAQVFLSFLEEQAWEQHGKHLSDVDPFTPTQVCVETDWANARMPYYNLWPAVIPSLTKLRLDVGCEHFTLPVPQLLIRLPVSHPHPLTFEHEGKEWRVQTIMASMERLAVDKKFYLRHGLKVGELIPAITFWLDINEVVDPADPMWRRFMYKHLLKLPTWSIERSFADIPSHDSTDVGVLYPESLIQDCARLVCTLCLMADDPEIVQPDVLTADKAKYEASRDPALVDKAHRRGKVGWNVGEGIEVVPHVRSACPAALYWTGEGRTVPRIRFRKGCVVHRRRLTEVPTGYLDTAEEGGHVDSGSD